MWSFFFDESSLFHRAHPRLSSKVMQTESLETVRSPLDGRKFLVDEPSASQFHHSAFRQLAQSLQPRERVSRTDAVIAQVLGLDGRVTTRLFRDLTTTSPLLDAAIDETMYALDEDEATVVQLRGSLNLDDIMRRAHATRWSCGRPVVWILHARSLFCPRVALSVRVNHDFDLYDLPHGYPGVIEVRDGLFQSLECEAFTCRAMAQRARVRVHGGDRRRFDMLSTCPPVPTRPLRRPTDLSFDPSDDSVDTKTAKRFVRVLFEEYAIAKLGEQGSWSDPLATGRWNPTSGHLLWTLLCLDEDDVFKMHHGLGNVENDPLGQVSKLTTSILMAPWFVTANYLDAVLGRSVPLGAGEDADIQHWDTSPVRWKSRLCMRAFYDPERPSARFLYECDNECYDNLRGILRDNHRQNPLTDPDDIIFSDVKKFRCAVCHGVEKETDRDDLKIGGEVVRPELRCKKCGTDEHLRYERLIKQARCVRKNCGCGNRWIDCDCCENEKLARKQWGKNQRLQWEVEDDIGRVSERVKKAKSRKILVRPRRDGEDKESYRAFTKNVVDTVAMKHESCTSLLCLTCETSEKVEDTSFDAEDLEFEDSDVMTLEARKIVEDAHDAMVPNAEWKVVKCVRDALLVTFEGGSEDPKKQCEHCVYGACEWWREDQKFHCVACKRGKQDKEEPGTEDTVMHIDQNAFGFCDSYSSDGYAVTRQAFYEIVMREMLRPYF